ncbi:beta-1,4-mannosyltransferase [Arthrobacter pascens]|nr:beta-1,4-mannosyltransferase [Arthrobacter pascens]
MLVDWQGYKPGPSSPVTEGFQALRSTAGPDGTAPFLLGFGSVARVNPYQALLYRSFERHGFAVTPVFDVTRLRELLHLKPMASGVGLHLHWTSSVIGGARNEREAVVKSNGFLGRIDRFKESGGKLVWTAHNIYPHDSRFVDVDLALQQGIAERADAVHVMANATASALGDHLRLDGRKVIVAPHPSYEGAYENYLSRSESRQSLGLDADELVFVLFGALKAYKGLKELADGFDELCRRRTPFRFRLLIAGAADEAPIVQDFVKWAVAHPLVMIDTKTVPQHRVQNFLNAADAGLLGYSRSLNSGAALLYQTFGLPVLATDTPVLREALDPASTRYFDPHSGASSYATNLQELASVSKNFETAALQTSLKEIAPELVSTRFAKALAAKLGVNTLG